MSTQGTASGDDSVALQSPQPLQSVTHDINANTDTAIRVVTPTRHAGIVQDEEHERAEEKIIKQRNMSLPHRKFEGGQNPVPTPQELPGEVPDDRVCEDGRGLPVVDDAPRADCNENMAGASAGVTGVSPATVGTKVRIPTPAASSHSDVVSGVSGATNKHRDVTQSTISSFLKTEDEGEKKRAVGKSDQQSYQQPHEVEEKAEEAAAAGEVEVEANSGGDAVVPPVVSVPVALGHQNSHRDRQRRRYGHGSDDRDFQHGRRSRRTEKTDMTGGPTSSKKIERSAKKRKNQKEEEAEQQQEDEENDGCAAASASESVGEKNGHGKTRSSKTDTHRRYHNNRHRYSNKPEEDYSYDRHRRDYYLSRDHDHHHHHRQYRQLHRRHHDAPQRRDSSRHRSSANTYNLSRRHYDDDYDHHRHPRRRIHTRYGDDDDDDGFSYSSATITSYDDEYPSYSYSDGTSYSDVKADSSSATCSSRTHSSSNSGSLEDDTDGGEGEKEERGSHRYHRDHRHHRRPPHGDPYGSKGERRRRSPTLRRRQRARRYHHPYDEKKMMDRGSKNNKKASRRLYYDYDYNVDRFHYHTRISRQQGGAAGPSVSAPVGRPITPVIQHRPSYHQQEVYPPLSPSIPATEEEKEEEDNRRNPETMTTSGPVADAADTVSVTPFKATHPPVGDVAGLVGDEGGGEDETPSSEHHHRQYHRQQPQCKQNNKYLHQLPSQSQLQLQQHQPPPSQRQRQQQSNWITLNVGGSLVTTSLSSLCSDPNSLLYNMFIGQFAMTEECGDVEGPAGNKKASASVRPWKLDRDQDGHVLIDAEYQYFMPVLNFLRYNKIIIPTNVPASGVKAVGEFFNVQGVIDHFNRDKRQVIFSWGSGGSGELGSREKSDVLNPAEVHIVPYHQRVTDIALGANYSCVMTKREGHVYTFGNGDWGQLGLGNPKAFHEKAEDKTPIVTAPTLVGGLRDKKVVSIACGYAYAMALTEDHQVYFWGNNNHGQSGLGALRFGATCRKIEDPVLVHTLQGKEIIQLGCGSFFVVALGKDGSLYSWGLIDCVGLGTARQIKESVSPDQIAESVSKDKRTVLLTPHKIALSTNEKVVGINAGQWHSCAITEGGSLYTWGVGFQGRLGHGDKEPCFIPQRVTHAVQGHRIAGVACGSFHTVVRTIDGAVFCWGDNANGQCGSNMHVEAVTLPEGVPSLRMIGGGNAIDVSCGRQHTAVVMSGPHRWCNNYCCQLDHTGRPKAEHGQVYVFGESKAMGLGTGQKLASAKLVPGMEAYNIQKVVSGLYHTFVLAEIIPPPLDS